MAKKKQIDKQFKIDAVNYRKHHPELTMAEVANNLGISSHSYYNYYGWYSSGYWQGNSSVTINKTTISIFTLHITIF